MVFTVVLQSGRDGLFGSDLLGNFYDGQARAILDGRLDVPPYVPGFEGFVVDGRTYIYQGLTPVIPRLGVQALTDSFDGRLTGVSMLIAQSIMISYVVAAAWRARRSICGLSEVRPVEQALIAISIFGIASGLVGFIASRAWVYHEAIAWGVAMSVASLVHLEILIDWIRRGHQREAPVRPMLHASLSTLFAGLAFNSRSSVGLGPLAISVPLLRT